MSAAPISESKYVLAAGARLISIIRQYKPAVAQKSKLAPKTDAEPTQSNLVVWLTSRLSRLMSLFWRGIGRSVTALLFICALAYGWAWLALLDRVSDQPATRVAGDLVVSNGKLEIATGNGQLIQHSGGRSHARRMVAHGGLDAVAAFITNDGRSIISVDAQGGVVQSDLNDRARPHDWWPAVLSHWAKAVWEPFLLPFGDWLLDHMANYVPFKVPDAAYAKRLGSFSDCSACPEMIRLSDGWAFTLDRSEVQTPRLSRWNNSNFAWSASPITNRQWQACVADGRACPSVPGGQPDQPVKIRPGEVQSFVSWLSQSTGRTYGPDQLDCGDLTAYKDFLEQCTGQARHSTRVRNRRVAGELQLGQLITFRVGTGNIGELGETAAEADLRSNIAAQNSSPNLSDSLEAVQSLPARLYIQIPQELGRDSVAAFRGGAQKLKLNGTPLVVPAVEEVKNVPNRTELRCFYVDDCAEASTLAAMLRPLIQTPIAVIQEIGRYPASRARPRHFEIWFGKEWSLSEATAS